MIVVNFVVVFVPSYSLATHFLEADIITTQRSVTLAFTLVFHLLGLTGGAQSMPYPNCHSVTRSAPIRMIVVKSTQFVPPFLMLMVPAPSVQLNRRKISAFTLAPGWWGRSAPHALTADTLGFGLH